MLLMCMMNIIILFHNQRIKIIIDTTYCTTYVYDLRSRLVGRRSTRTAVGADTLRILKFFTTIDKKLMIY